MKPDTKILIPMIRKVLPTIIAQDIVGVQPMSDPRKPTYKILTLGWEAPEGFVVVSLSKEIENWVREQPVDLWMIIDSPQYSYSIFTISNELLTALTLKWS